MLTGMKIRLIITYLLNLFDLAMTTLWVKLYGIDAEANPIGRWLFENNLAGVVKIFVVGALLLLLGYLLKRYPKYKYVALLLCVVYAIIAMYHLYLLVKIV